MMQSTAWWRTFARVAPLFLVIFGVGNKAQAGLITYGSIAFTSPVFQFGSGGDAIVDTTTTGEYSFSGEFCVNESCSGGATSTLADSLLRLTNMTLTCTNPVASGVCAPIDVLFQANDETSFISSGMLDVELNGSGSASGFARVCLQDMNNICASDLTGPLSVTVPFSGSVSGGDLISSVPFSPGFTLLGDFHLDGLPQSSTVMLGSSLDIGLSGAGGVAIPEPSPAWLVPLGAILLAVFRRAASALSPQSPRER